MGGSEREGANTTDVKRRGWGKRQTQKMRKAKGITGSARGKDRVRVYTRR